MFFYLLNLCEVISVLIMFLVFVQFNFIGVSIKSVIDILMILCRFGEWESVDGNSLQIKLFKSGMVYVEIYLEVVYKLNDILFMLYLFVILE